MKKSVYQEHLELMIQEAKKDQLMELSLRAKVKILDTVLERLMDASLLHDGVDAYVDGGTESKDEYLGKLLMQRYRLLVNNVVDSCLREVLDKNLANFTHKYIDDLPVATVNKVVGFLEKIYIGKIRFFAGYFSEGFRLGNTKCSFGIAESFDKKLLARLKKIAKNTKVQNISFHDAANATYFRIIPRPDQKASDLKTLADLSLKKFPQKGYKYVVFTDFNRTISDHHRFERRLCSTQIMLLSASSIYESHKRLLAIVGHLSPDMDCMNSMVLFTLLRSNDVLTNEEFEQIYQLGLVGEMLIHKELISSPTDLEWTKKRSIKKVVKDEYGLSEEGWNNIVSVTDRVKTVFAVAELTGRTDFGNFKHFPRLNKKIELQNLNLDMLMRGVMVQLAKFYKKDHADLMMLAVSNDVVHVCQKVIEKLIENTADPFHFNLREVLDAGDAPYSDLLTAGVREVVQHYSNTAEMVLRLKKDRDSYFLIDEERFGFHKKQYMYLFEGSDVFIRPLLNNQKNMRVFCQFRKKADGGYKMSLFLNSENDKSVDLKKAKKQMSILHERLRRSGGDWFFHPNKMILASGRLEGLSEKEVAKLKGRIRQFFKKRLVEKVDI